MGLKLMRIQCDHIWTQHLDYAKCLTIPKFLGESHCYNSSRCAKLSFISDNNTH